MTGKKPDVMPAGVERDAPHPDSSNPSPDSSEEENEEEHKGPHADNYDELAETTNDPASKNRDR